MSVMDDETLGGPLQALVDRGEQHGCIELSEIDELVDESLAFDVRLLVSELVTNSVKYGGEGPVRLEITNSPDAIRTEIVDQGTGFAPKQRDGDLSRVGGWGLHLVERLSRDWGVREGSTHVWFELAP